MTCCSGSIPQPHLLLREIALYQAILHGVASDHAAASSIATATGLPEHAEAGTRLQVLYMNEPFPVTVAPGLALFDPSDTRMKA